MHEVIRVGEEFLQECNAGDFTKTSIVLQELLSNAIVHGNRNNPTQSVYCLMRHVGEGRLMIVVEDEGEGFDFARLDTSIPDDSRHVRNRGYTLIQNMCSKLEFNERGNRVTAYVDQSDAVRRGQGAAQKPSDAGANTTGPCTPNGGNIRSLLLLA